MTREQLETTKTLMEFCQNFADQILKIMQNNGLDLVEGACVTIDVDPRLQFVTKSVMMGRQDTEFGYVRMVKGYADKNFVLSGKNTAEFERIFADPAVAELLQEAEKAEKPFPPDGLWISAYDDPPLLDDRRDVNAEVL